MQRVDEIQKGDSGLRVVHVWNTAGIGGLLARNMDRLWGHDSFCVMREAHDPYKLANEKVKLFRLGTRLFIAKSLLASREADIVHIHSGFAWLRFFKELYPNKKYIIQLHGTDIRDKWDEIDLAGFDRILVSTPDLLEGSPEGTIHLPRVIDWELIHSIQNEELDLKWNYKTGEAFHWDYGALDVAQYFASKFKLHLVIHPRNASKFSHKAFLRRLKLFEVYIDVKRGKGNYLLEALSLTGLESLALGLRVINYRGEYVDGFPELNETDKVCSKLNDVYQGLFE